MLRLRLTGINSDITLNSIRIALLGNILNVDIHKITLWEDIDLDGSYNSTFDLELERYTGNFENGEAILGRE